MNKVERHQADLEPLLEGFFDTGEEQLIRAYLETHSNLPGRRGNLELSRAFGDVVADVAPVNADVIWPLCCQFTGISAAEAGVNEPASFLVFCGTEGIGAVGAVCSDYTERALVQLRSLARDPRWRIREAVSIGLTRLLLAWPEPTLTALERWVAEGKLLEMRAAAAAVAEPRLLKDEAIARRGLALHQSIFEQFVSIPATARKSEPFRVLRKGLGFTFSVVVCAVPEEGFLLLRSMIDTDDRDVAWIVRENLKKKRLSRVSPTEVEALAQLL